jgi:hypothetical protein
MDPIVLLKIKSLNARTSPETGLKIRPPGSEIRTVTIVAHLDDSAEVPANMGMIDLATGTIQLRWAVIAKLRFMADAFASGSRSQKESSPLRASLEESGQVLDDGTGFNVQGTGKIAPGSVLGKSTIALHNNAVKLVGDGRAVTSIRALAAGEVVRCALVPDSSYLDVALSKSLGGGTQRLNLVGRFLLVPVMILQRPEPTKRSRR